MNFKLVVSALALILSIGACSSEEHSGQNENNDIQTDQTDAASVDTTSESNIQTFEAAGSVTSVPPGNRNIIIKHGDIPGFMDPMTMPFQVKDSTVLSGIATGDSIHFFIRVENGQTRITEIQKIE